MVNTLRSPLKWIGGKSASAERIVKSFPDPTAYDRYVEVCGGGASVLIAKPPYEHEEIYCDLDNNLVTFWQEVQIHAQEMQAYLDSLLYARKLYYEFYRSLFDGTSLTPFERATRWFYVLRSTGTGWIRKSPVGWDNRGSNIQAYRNVLEVFEVIQERFRYVAVDNRDVLATVKRYDSPRTLFYADPPYFGTEHYYEVSKTGFPHEGLAQMLQQVEGQVALSYYPHPSIDAWYPESRWQRITWQQHKSSQIQIPDRLDIATEMLLCNYSLSTGLWDEREVVA